MKFYKNEINISPVTFSLLMLRYKYRGDKNINNIEKTAPYVK